MTPLLPRTGVSRRRRFAPSGGGGGAILTRTTEGLLARYVYDEAGAEFDLADWEEQTSVGLLQIEGTGELRHSGSGSATWHYVRHTASASRSKRMVQTLSRTFGSLVGQVWIGQGGHFESGAAGDQISGGVFSVERSGSDRHAARQQTGDAADVNEAVDATNKAAGGVYRHSAFVDGTSVVSYDFDSDDTRSVTGTRSEGWAGLFGDDTDAILRREVYDCTDRELVAKGLETGWKAKVLDGADAVLAEATESGGEATVDLFQVDLSAVAAVILTDGADAEQIRFTPASGEKQVAPGDQFSYAA